MGTSPYFSAIFGKETFVTSCLLGSQRGQTPTEANSFLYEFTPNIKGGKNSSVAFSTGILILAVAD